MAKKVYKHNNYYGYINRVLEKALSNPEWFWSNAEDAVKVRQWLHDNNAGAIVDEIYDNTPDNIKNRIPYKKLTSNKAQETYNKKITEGSNEASKYVAGTLAASAAMPYVISSFPAIASELAATSKFLATPAGKAALSKFATDYVLSTAIGDGINESAKSSGYEGFGDLALQSAGVDPKTKNYNYISGAVDFLNPGYFMGGSAANRVWNASKLNAIEANNLASQAIERNKPFRNAIDNTKQSISNSFNEGKDFIVKRVKSTKNDILPQRIPEVSPTTSELLEQIPIRRYTENAGTSTTRPDLEELDNWLWDLGPQTRTRIPVEETATTNVTIAEPEVVKTTSSWLGGSRSIFDDALEREADDLNRSLSTLTEEDFKNLAPLIKEKVTQLRDNVISSGKNIDVDAAQDMIRRELIDLYRTKNKLYKVELPNISLGTRARTGDYGSRKIFWDNNNLLDVIFNNGKAATENWKLSNPTISASPYTIDTVPLEFTNTIYGPPVGSYSHMSVFGRNPKDLRALLNTLFGDTTVHGKLVYEPNKSLDSTRMFNKHAAKAARDGRGVVLYSGLNDINRTDNMYKYVTTNDLAGTIYNPHIDKLGTLAEPSTKKIADNVRAFSQLLESTDPRVFKAFGGTPEFKVYIRGPERERQVIDLPYKAIKDQSGKQRYVFEFLDKDSNGNFTSQAWKTLDDFDQEMLSKKAKGEDIFDYELRLVAPLTGFRSFKNGGIIKRK